MSLTRVILGFGSNMGDRINNIREALMKISRSENFLLLAVSNIYESEPWGFKNQNKFLNCVAAGLYRKGPLFLLSELKKIERLLGRQKKRKWHPRKIDIDILFFGEKIFNNPNLVIPHPLIYFRNFVLKPLNELAPKLIHPVFSRNILYLQKTSPDKGEVYLYKKQISH